MRGVSGKQNTRARQQVNNVNKLLFNIREPPSTILLSLFTASDTNCD
jgi:hypothetical protein